MLLNLFQGFCMALADSVPGVSGGTVAFILGFYEPFLNAVHSLFGKDSAARKAAFLYLLKLGVGWGAGLIGSILLLARLFENNIYFLSSLFFGLTLASIPCIVKAERRQILGRPQNFPFALLGLALVCGLTWFRAGSSSGGALDYTALGPLQYGYLFLSGALAISAMVLPGISGSSLLLIMGVYLPTVNAAHALLHLEFSVLPGVFALGLGVLTGAALSVRALRTALRKQRSRMLWLILGLMLGSLASIAAGPSTLEPPRAPLGLDNFSLPGFFLGIAALLDLEGLKKLTQKRERGEQAAFMEADGNAEAL